MAQLGKWENPIIIGENVLPPHSSFVSENKLSLNGVWSFRCLESADGLDESFAAEDSDVAKWDTIDVPCCWEPRGFGRPYYYGANYPPAISTVEAEIPSIDHSQTCVAQYKRVFDLPADWTGQRIILRFGSVKAAFYCWVNGVYAGLGKGSMLPVEFDVTGLVRAGENTVSLQVYQFSDVTYLEDQDMWFLSGVYRDVDLIAEPAARIDDLVAVADLDEDYLGALLTVNVRTNGCANGSAVQVSLLDGERISASGSGFAHQDALKLQVRCENIKTWSAETPHVYHIRASLPGVDGSLHERMFEFGFRRIERKNELLLINGQPLKIRGINYHAFTPDHGYHVPPEVLEQDLITMKRYNINAIRTSHYPQDDLFYSLCNRFGIYVMNECNLETHAVREKNVPGSNPLWTPHVVDRIERMVTRDRNHPCVVIWSLGNESDIGENFFKMRAATLALDPTRPIHYEGGANLQVSDFVCVGYDSPEREQMFADGLDVPAKGGVVPSLDPDLEMSLKMIRFEKYKNHPIVATEYMHTLGNTGSDMTRHMNIFESSPRWCGGFIWDFKDKALRRRMPDGSLKLGYGGDFGERDQRGNFGCNGVVAADGQPHEQIEEIKKAYQTIVMKRLPDGWLEVTNRNSFVSLEIFDCRWSLLCDGKVMSSGILVADVPPRSTCLLEVPSFDTTLPGDYFLIVSFHLKADTAWAPQGYEIAFEQWPIGDHRVQSALPINVPFVLIGFDYSACAAGRRVVINGATGNLDDICTQDGNQLMTPIRPSFHRPKTDADYGFMGLAYGRDHDRDFWAKISLGDIPLTSDVRIETDGSLTAGSRLYDGDQPMGLLVRSYRMLDDGRLTVRFTFTAAENHAPLRIGLQAELSRDLHAMTWLGLGRHDTYWGREESGKIGIYTKDVTEQDEHMRPHEHGNKRGVRWLTLTGNDGQGLKVASVGAPFAASAWPYTLADLHEARHIEDLPTYQTTTLNIDCLQNGLGDAFVPLTDKYKIKGGVTYEYEVILQVI